MTAEQFVEHASTCQRLTDDGRWIPAKPLPAPLIWRIKAAWQVLTGKAEAVTFEE